MKSAYYEENGPARDVLRISDLPTPTPGPGEVRVRLAWSGVNPSDVKGRSGAIWRPMAFPKIIPHSDGSGVIDAVGENVSSSRINEPVWVWNGAWQRPFGTAAEYIVLPAEQAVRLPEGVDLAAGACLGIPALTALHAVAVNGGVAGKTVLVTGGAGAVGHYAIQFARLMGAEKIIATVSSHEKGALASSAGADLILNYRTDNLKERVAEATAGEGIDRIIDVDFAVNADSDLELIKPDCDIIVYGSSALEMKVPFIPAILKNVGIKFFIVYNLSREDRAWAITYLNKLLGSGRLIHNIAARMPLAQIADAHELIEQGRANGNVVLSIA